MNDLKVSLVQTSLVWENVDANLALLKEKVLNLSDTDIVFLPEMFTTGFSMKPEKWAETMNGKSVSWMIDLAHLKGAVITGSLIIEEGGNYYNRLIWAQPDGVVLHYDKRHRFSYAGEDDHYQAGKDRVTWEYLGWRIRPQICYDLRFPVWSRNDDEYDLLFYVANWPERRKFPWKSLLTARAIENMAYVIGVNRVGLDGNEIEHSGDSAVLNALGENVSIGEPNKEVIVSATLSAKHIQEVRTRFRFLNDADPFTLG